jgi:gamma-glutamyl-gamma-aminobutyrate hydrolase PuuD
MDNFNDPVIGIVTQPLSKYFKKHFDYKLHQAYIASSYKKWVEQTGARAVIIPHFSSMSTLENLMNQINGLLIPGGSTSLIIK